jgi:hypothetical protein
LAPRSSAAAPATCGDAAEVPVKPPVQPLAGPVQLFDPASGPLTSGLMRPSMVGPRLLYGWLAPVAWQCAPTASTAGEVAGSGSALPVNSSIWITAPSKKKSMRGVAPPLYRFTTRLKSCGAPVQLATVSCSMGGAIPDVWSISSPMPKVPQVSLEA